ncbi:winged-helix domain-containing protein [Oceanispirochaeta sp.]|jgi:redox-sensing transcriptional repressor|uniref:winged-helix domain-containing protein n=1 Tax=Oceanispirochaeta sp. TaxID=2035350 RepID=UPI002620E374|nr:winged-helix domain-containing protein [Oceanispirochaeta sp.]MDA3957169.1 hypothetical protein [Oceanispirochaeta sp.]
MLKEKLSEAAHFRMIRLYITLSRMESEWSQTTLTSGELANFTGTTAELIRKDLSFLGCPAEGRGYKTNTLLSGLKEKLHLNVLKAGLAGLDSWGSILIRESGSFQGLQITAAFDGSQNRLERTETRISLYPSYEIKEVFQKEKIRIGILASETAQPDKNLQRMLAGGARGIINLTSCPLTVPKDVYYYQADLSLGFLSMISRINESKK